MGYPLLKYIAGSELHWIGEISAVRGHFPGAQSGRPSVGLEFISLMYLTCSSLMMWNFEYPPSPEPDLPPWYHGFDKVGTKTSAKAQAITRVRRAMVSSGLPTGLQRANVG